MVYLCAGCETLLFLFVFLFIYCSVFPLFLFADSVWVVQCLCLFNFGVDFFLNDCFLFVFSTHVIFLLHQISLD